MNHFRTAVASQKYVFPPHEPPDGQAHDSRPSTSMNYRARGSFSGFATRPRNATQRRVFRFSGLTSALLGHQAVDLGIDRETS